MFRRVMEGRWGASMVATAGLIHLAAPGSIPGRSNRSCEVVGDVLPSALYQACSFHIETHEAPQ